ncbi:MAG TPA: alpha/beta fold hydrolase [Acidimicrobiia bacterium]|nr:alpha/beta fold hydrolase [Acidimicrobiia bacterium]
MRRDPVLLVHGFDGSSKSWRTMEARLRAAGYRADQIDAISYDSEASSVSAAHVIARAVARLEARTGAARVDVVSHSLGAIASRYYVEQLGGDAHVDAWVSLAGVNDGTLWAYGCYLLASCRDMAPGSSVLDTLARDFRPDGSVRFATWWSPCDPMIVPSSAATIPGAQNTETACLGHSDLKTDPTVFGQVARFVGQRHRPVLGRRAAL